MADRRPTPPRRCRNCGEEFPPRMRKQVYCSQSCYNLDHLSRLTAKYRKETKARDFMNRQDPLVARALALSMWPMLRTEDEQKALDKWLQDRIEQGIGDWERLAADLRGTRRET